jgi:hypothetical protein
LAAAAPLATSAPATTTRYACKYRGREAETEGMGGILMVYPEPDSTILFQLDANSGAPT